MNSVVYCEGFQDRAFVSAWIDWLAEREERPISPVRDEQSRRLRIERSHVKQSKDRQLSIVAGDGDSDLAERAALLVRKYGALIDRLVLVVDADEHTAADRRQQLATAFSSKAPGYTGQPSVLVWEPQLEIVIERALRAARPSALGSIDAFLQTAVDVSKTDKETAFTFCAAWEPDSFGDTFFQQVWRLVDVRDRLQADLKQHEPLLLSLL